MSGAVREALARLAVHLVADGAAPPLAADALALHAEAVAGALGVGAVGWREENKMCYKLMPGLSYSNVFLLQLTFLAGLPSEAPGAEALSADTLAVPATVGHLALIVPQLALGALPPGEAPACAVLVVAVARAQHRADACGKEERKKHLFIFGQARLGMNAKA